MSEAINAFQTLDSNSMILPIILKENLSYVLKKMHVYVYTPLSPINFQIYKKWPSPVFCFSKSMVFWGYKINITKKKFLSDFYFMDIGSL